MILANLIAYRLSTLLLLLIYLKHSTEQNIILLNYETQSNLTVASLLGGLCYAVCAIFDLSDLAWQSKSLSYFILSESEVKGLSHFHLI